MMVEAVFNTLRSNGLTSKLAACLLLLRKVSYLGSIGWFKSFRLFLPVDGNGNALPWYTYAAINFLKPRVNGDMRVFEYGSGNSTLWWASHVAQVVSCEHDEAWYTKMKPQLPENVHYMHHDLITGGEYSKAILSRSEKFDIVVIDGRDRVNCIKNSMGSLKDDGVVVWDNSDREQYREGYEILAEGGFRRLDFYGFGPINAHGWGTSVFYRSSNCLGL